jgi:hypothetical protein
MNFVPAIYLCSSMRLAHTNEPLYTRSYGMSGVRKTYLTSKCIARTHYMLPVPWYTYVSALNPRRCMPKHFAEIISLPSHTSGDHWAFGQVLDWSWTASHRMVCPTIYAKSLSWARTVAYWPPSAQRLVPCVDGNMEKLPPVLAITSSCKRDRRYH